MPFSEVARNFALIPRGPAPSPARRSPAELGPLAAVCAQRVPGITGSLLIYPTVDFGAVTPAMSDHADQASAWLDAFIAITAPRSAIASSHTLAK